MRKSPVSWGDFLVYGKKVREYLNDVKRLSCLGYRKSLKAVKQEVNV